MKKVLCRLPSDLPSLPERIIFNVSLFKPTNQKLGISIVGGKGRLLDGIFIKHIMKDGFIYRTGLFNEGDQILMLNNKTFLDLTHAQAVDYLISCPSRLEIMVSRMVIRSQSDLLAYSLSSHSKRLLSSPYNISNVEPDIMEYKPIL